jgi:FkbM family methyltransferase
MGITSKLLLEIYQVLGRVFIKLDPVVKVRIGKKFLFLNLSHQLPVYYYKYPQYDRALPRICRALKRIDKRLYVIDIGANIGDTVSLITDVTKGNFLCVEGDEKYLPTLERNIKQISGDNHIKIERSYCGNEGKAKAFIVRKEGTAKIVKSSQSNIEKNGLRVLKIKSLDKIIENNPRFKNANLLKIDTDGFEKDILESGKKFVRGANPLLYFEFTPEVNSQNRQDKNTIWSLLRGYGYKEALFYDNFGGAVEIINLDNQDKIDELVNKINNKNIYYYDILAYQASENKYSKILRSELNLFRK